MDEAIAWHLGLEEAGSEEWRHFVAWLEADTDHQDAYDRVTMADADLADAFAATPVPLRPRRPIVQLPQRTWLKRTGWVGGMVAAAAAAWLAFMPATVASPDTYSISTKPGMRNVVKLPDGTRIEMNGGTAVTLDRNNPRVATLDSGEARFQVTHHADRPFEVHVNGMTLRDVGTVFNVVRTAGFVDVAVAEGSVMFQPNREAVSLNKGMALSMHDGQDQIELRHVNARAVGSWVEGRLDYRNIPMASVADDVARATGVKVRLDGAMAARPFTGTLQTDRAPEAVMKSLAALVGGNAHRDGPTWVISPKSPSAS